MRIRLFVNALAGFGLLVALASPSRAQTPQAAPPQQPDTSSATPAPRADNAGAIRLLYTGKTFGYFRVPDWQGPTATGDGCKGTRPPKRQKRRGGGIRVFASERRQVNSRQWRDSLGYG